MELKTLKSVLLFTVFSFWFIPLAYAQVNQTAIQEGIDDLEPFLDTSNQFPVFFPVFFMVLLFLMMFYSFKAKAEGWASSFSFASFIISAVLTFMFVSPFDFVMDTNEKHFTIEEINWLDGNQTYNYAYNEFKTSSVIIPNNTSTDFILTYFFTAMMFFNALFGILILTYFRSR